MGVAERWDGAGYRAAKVTFGAQPTDAEILQWVEKEWHRLRFSPPQAEPERSVPERSNPKLARREAARAVERRGLGTKAQQALSAQREQEGEARRARSREDRRAEAERKFLLRQVICRASTCITVNWDQITPASTRANRTNVTSRAMENIKNPALNFLP